MPINLDNLFVDHIFLSIALAQPSTSLTSNKDELLLIKAYLTRKEALEDINK
jgi:hypothetical protein